MNRSRVDELHVSIYFHCTNFIVVIFSPPLPQFASCRGLTQTQNAANMPCLILTGHPSAGKSTLARLIEERAIQNHGTAISHKVILINESSACPKHTLHQCYHTSAAEKATRGALKAAFDRAMAEFPHALVILDSLNYLKGFRYELYCLCKAAQQQHAVIWVLNSLPVARQWNQQRQHQKQDESEMNSNEQSTLREKGDGYSNELFEELVLRYEPPDDRNRWDKPLFRIHVQPETSDTMDTAAPQQEALVQSVYNMHNLSSVLGRNDDNPVTSSTAEMPQPATEKKKPKIKFKRAAKKPPTTATAPPSEPKTVYAVPTESAMSAFLAAGNDEFERNSKTQTFDLANNDATEMTQKAQDSKEALGSTAIQPPPREKKSVTEQVDDMLTNFLQSTQRLQQGMSTQQHMAHANADLIHLLDKVTNIVCRALVEYTQKADSDAASELVLQNLPGTSGSVTIPITNPDMWRKSLSLHQSWRRQYLQWCSTHPPDQSGDAAALARAFCDYLQAQLPGAS